jgi:hypothetical protein
VATHLASRVLVPVPLRCVPLDLGSCQTGGKVSGRLHDHRGGRGSLLATSCCWRGVSTRPCRPVIVSRSSYLAALVKIGSFLVRFNEEKLGQLDRPLQFGKRYSQE